MSTETEPEPLKPYHLAYLTTPFTQLAETVAAYPDRMLVKHRLAGCLRTLEEAFHMLEEAKVPSEEVCDFLSAMHTYTRKAWDGPLSTILYRLIDAKRGKRVWHAFGTVAYAVFNPENKYPAPKRNKRDGSAWEPWEPRMRDLKEGLRRAFPDRALTTDEQLLLSAFELWLDEDDDVSNAIVWSMGEEWEPKWAEPAPAPEPPSA